MGLSLSHARDLMSIESKWCKCTICHKRWFFDEPCDQCREITKAVESIKYSVSRKEAEKAVDDAWEKFEP